GAEFGPNFPDFEVEIPDHRRVTVHQLLDQFPNYETVTDLTGTERANLLQEFHKLFINAKADPIDGFMQLRISQGSAIAKSLNLSLQMKMAEEYDSKKPRILNQTEVGAELSKFGKVNDTLKDCCQDLECAFGIFSNRRKAENLELYDGVEYEIEVTKLKIKKKEI